MPFSRLPAPVARTVHRLLQIDRLENLYDQTRSRAAFFSGVLEELDVETRVSPTDLGRIPASGAVIALSTIH